METVGTPPDPPLVHTLYNVHTKGEGIIHCNVHTKGLYFTHQLYSVKYMPMGGGGGGGGCTLFIHCNAHNRGEGVIH